MYRFDMTALSACIFLPLLLCSGGVFPLPLQKPQMLYIVHGWNHSKMYFLVQCLIADTASIAVRKQPSLYMYAFSHTAGTGYGKNKIIAIHTKIKDVHLTSLLHKLSILVLKVKVYKLVLVKIDV